MWQVHKRRAKQKAGMMNGLRRTGEQRSERPETCFHCCSMLPVIILTAVRVRVGEHGVCNISICIKLKGRRGEGEMEGRSRRVREYENEETERGVTKNCFVSFSIQDT